MERVEDALLPLINLVFLLLMFFIVAGKLSETPLPDLPGTTAQDKPQLPEADLMLAANGDWSVGGEPVSPDNLLARLPAPDQEQPLKIAAEKGISMSQLEELLLQLENGGYQEVILLTEPAQ